MSAILYWFVIKPISLLPYPLLYGVSDFFYVILYHVIGYRKKVVTDNLKKSFPEKSEKEIKSLRGKFYRHFSDIVFESLKNFSITKKQAEARMQTENTDIFDNLHRQGKSVILCGGHYCNWELWAVATPDFFKHRLKAIYKQLSNPYFDKKMRVTRGRFGLDMISTKEFGNYFLEHREELTVSVFAIDQSPSNPNKSVWIDFLGRETATHYGAEKYARMFNYPVVYGHLSKVKRGYYKVRYELVTMDPEKLEHGELTQQMHRLLEADIRKAPEYWLWSHKRWKHKKSEDENFHEEASNH